MYQIQQDTTLKLQIGPWTLRFLGQQLYLTQWGDRPVNARLAFFVDKRSLTITVNKYSSTKISFSLNEISAKGEIEILPSGVSLAVQSKEPIGFMWPAIGQTYFGDLIEPIDFRFTHVAAYDIKTDDPTIAELRAPLVTHSADTLLSLIFRAPVKFAAFMHEACPYCNAMTNDLNILFVEHRSRSEVLTQKIESRKIHQFISPPSMKQLIFSGTVPDYFPQDDLVSIAVDVQSKLKNQGIESCVVGSLAVSLHGVDCLVHDIDMLVSRLPDQVEGYYASVSPSSKWTHAAIRLTKEHQIDLSLIPDFDIKAKSETIGGIQVLNKKDLVHLKLIALAECLLMTPWNTNFRQKNIDSIFALLQADQSNLYEFFRVFINSIPTARFVELCDLFRNAQPSNQYVNVDFPCVANSFDSGSRMLIPVVNTGESQPTCVRTDMVFKQVEWKPLYDTSSAHIDIINLPIGSQITIDQVRDLGVLICQ